MKLKLYTHYHIILAHNRIVVNPHSYKYSSITARILFNFNND